MGRYSIVYEDESLLVVNKAPGLLVIATPKGETNTLTDLLNEYLAKKSSGDFAKAHPCHRLDRETSGIVLFAKGKSVQQKMMEQFHNREISKKYFAFIQGHPRKQTSVIDFRLEGKEALTKYRVLKYHPAGWAFAEAEPVTGRTNQIRLHFKMIGHPIVGDRKFVVAKNYNIRFKRLALHAAAISFNHPANGQRIDLTCDLPDDMKSMG